MRWAISCNALLAMGCFVSVAAAQPAEVSADPALPRGESAAAPAADPAHPAPPPEAGAASPPADSSPAAPAPIPAAGPTPATTAAPAPPPPASAADAAPPPEPQPPPADVPPAAPVVPEPAPAEATSPAAPAANAAPPPPDRGLSSPAAEAEGPGRAPSLYIRLAAGLGFPFGPDVADAYDDRNGEALHFSGFSFATDWMAGSAVLPWLVLGVGMASDTVVSGTVRDREDAERSLQTSLYYLVLGGFADIYFSPPAGLHAQALIGLGHLSRSDDLGDGATGLGAAFGIGYELAVGRRWNVGVLGRVAVSPLSRDAIAGEQPSPTFYEPALLWTATFRPEH